MSIGCVTRESDVKEVLKKNPKIVFDLLEDNPEQFIQVINNAAKKAQQIEYDKQISRIKNEQEGDLLNPKQPKLIKERRLVGDSSANIVVVEYADFQCPACKVAYESLKQFKEKYKSKVQFYYKHMPLDFHKMAYLTALYYEAILLQDRRKAFRFYEYTFQNQRGLTDEKFLKAAARFSGANLAQLEKDIQSDSIRKNIEEDTKEFQKFGFTGTPVVIVNGVAIHGAQRLEELERVLRLTESKVRK
jgi:protein-disulfide isomerase